MREDHTHTLLPVSCLFALALAALLPAAVSGAEVDGIAAKVGDETILKSDVVLDGKRLTVRKSQALTAFSIVP